MSKRKGFNFYASYFDVYMELPDKEKVKFMDALLKKQFEGVEPTQLSGMARFAYISQKHSIEQQVKGWEDKTGYKLTPTEGGGATPTEHPTQQEQVQGEEKEEEKEKVQGQPGKQVYPEYVYKCFDLCIIHFEEHLRPKDEKSKAKWLDTIDKLHRIDKIPYQKIVDIVEATRNNDFWNKNFLSLTKLRKKNGDQVMYIVVFNAQMKSNGKGQQTNGQQYSKEWLDQLAKDLK